MKNIPKQVQFHSDNIERGAMQANNSSASTPNKFGVGYGAHYLCVPFKLISRQPEDDNKYKKTVTGMKKTISMKTGE